MVCEIWWRPSLLEHSTTNILLHRLHRDGRDPWGRTPYEGEEVPWPPGLLVRRREYIIVDESTHRDSKYNYMDTRSMSCQVGFWFQFPPQSLYRKEIVF